MTQKAKFDEFLEEVEQDIRQDKYNKLWEKYGKTALTITGIFLFTATAYSIYTYYHHQYQLNNSDYLLSAQKYANQGKWDQALNILNEIKPSALFRGENAQSYPVVADLIKAGILVEKGTPENIEQAQKIFNKVAHNKEASPLMQRFAALQEIRVSYTKDPKTATELLTTLEPFTADGEPYQGLALELKGIMLESSGKTKEAADTFAKLATLPDLAEGLSMRSQLMSKFLGSGN